MELSGKTSSAIDGLYYELGENYEIGDSGLVSRYHKGEFRSQNEDVTSITHTTFLEGYGNNLYKTLSVSAQYVNNVVGDSVLIKATVGGDTQGDILGQIMYVDPLYLIINTAEQLSTDISNVTYSKIIETKASAVGIAINGDSFLRSRIYDTTWNAGSSLLAPVLCETTSGSDIVKMFNDGLGRSQVQKRDKISISRESSIIISETINEDTNFFGVTSFPNTAFDWVDLDNSFGQVDKMVNMNDNLYVFQDSRVGIQQVAKDILTTAAGTGQVTLTANVFGSFIPILDGIGLRGIADGYVQEYEGTLTFVDPMGKSIYNIRGKDISNISTVAIHSDFINDSFSKNISCFIPDRKEYLIHLDSGIYAYSLIDKKWNGVWEYEPDYMVYAYDGYYSMSNGKLFKHEDTSNYNEMYDSNGDLATFDSSVTIYANDPKFTKKSYKSMGIIGSNLDLVTSSELYTNESRTSAILSFRREEGRWVADIGGGYADDSTIATHLRGIGLAVSSNGVDTVGFKEVPNYVLIGDILYQDENYMGIITAIDGLSVTYTGSAPQPTGFWTSAKPTAKDGLDMKGEWISTDIIFGQSGGVEYITAIELEGFTSAPTK